MGPGPSDASPYNQRLTVPEAAEALGITEAAVRGRVRRGTLRSVREGRTVYVVLAGDAPATNRDAPVNRDAPSGEPTDQSELIAELRAEVAAWREETEEDKVLRDTSSDELIAELRDTVQDLRVRLDRAEEARERAEEARNEADRENRRLLALASEQRPVIEAPPEPPQAARTDAQTPEGASPRSGTVGRQGGVLRSLWRFLIGG